ncbi:hypothetical protein, partial [Leuconostoc mesenteroides]
YLAIRIAMEWAIVEPYLPVSQPEDLNDMNKEELIASWIQWGNFSMQSWKALSIEAQQAHIQFAYRFNEQFCR